MYNFSANCSIKIMVGSYLSSLKSAMCPRSAPVRNQVFFMSVSLTSLANSISKLVDSSGFPAVCNQRYQIDSEIREPTRFSRAKPFIRSLLEIVEFVTSTFFPEILIHTMKKLVKTLKINKLLI